MRAHQAKKHRPSWFFQNNRQFLALSQVPQALKLTTSEVTDAVSRQELEVVRINGCKTVAFEDLLRFIDLREARK